MQINEGQNTKKVLKKESLFRRIRIDNRYDYQTMFTNYGT